MATSPAKDTSAGAKKKGGLLSFFGRGATSTASAAGVGALNAAAVAAPAQSKAGNETQKITAAVAATKVTKQKKARDGFKLPLIGDKPAEKQLPILLALAGLCLLITIAAIYFDGRARTILATHTNISSQLQYHSQRLAKAAGLAARGDVTAFAQMQASRDEFEAFLKVLNDGGFAFDVEVPSACVTDELKQRIEELSKRFATAAGSSTAILAAKGDLVALAENAAKVRAGSEDLASQSQDLASQMLQGGVAPGQVLRVNRLTILAERLGRNSAELLGADEIAPETPFLMGKDTNDFRELLKALEAGSSELGISAVRDADGKAQVDQLREQFTTFEKSVAPILGNVQKLVAARLSGRSLQQGSEQLLSNVQQIQDALAASRDYRALIVALVFGILSLLFLGLIAMVFLSDARRRAAASEAENKRNQEAILRLLNEMGDLADGDLTIRAKVTEDITGAIADSMNYTIEELRTLVTGVNSASSQVSSKSQQAQAVSVQLLSAAEKQSKEIQDTTQDVLKVAATLTAVSASAEESSGVAMRSLAASDKGRQAVQNSITGMNDIRLQIQDTSKRIKRLGESSQEIGEIVELISDITEQTNVLALNAAIQAASAGEAGRGFSVVAEEVQRLAERSAEATKQISAIVKTIQADTQDAVAAMEKSTTGVVEGAKLSDAAGQALNEIDSVTKNLAQLIQKISADTQAQVTSTNKVARNMQDILEFTQQTTTGTQQTANSIKELADVANDLKSSVSGFKL